MLDVLNQQRQKEVEQFENLLVEYRAVQDVIDDVREIIVERLAKEPEFLELSTRTLALLQIPEIFKEFSYQKTEAT